MRSVILSNRVRLACRVAAASLVVGALAGCSSEITRFDRSLYSAAEQAPEQQYSQNAYPAGVDPMATASVRRVPLPAEAVDPRTFEDGHTTYTQYSPQSQGYTPPRAAYNAPQAAYAPPAPPAAQYRPPVAKAPSVQRQALPALAPATVDPVRTSSIAPAAPAQPRLPAAPASVRPVQERVVQEQRRVEQRVASVETPPALAPASIAPAPALPPAAPARMAGDEKGWTATGGTAITLREGETLYNLSKRYGVPVKALMSANNITDASSVAAGSRVIIPTYVYSRSAPVSAPDNDPNTLRASSARGAMVEPAVPAISAVPQPRPTYTAALEGGDERVDPRYEPKRRAKEPASDNNVPDYSITTGSVSAPAAGTVTVKSGDTLSRIASANGVSVTALRKANGLTSDNIRIGQVLVLPGAGAVTSAPPPAAKVDPVVTATPAAPPAKPVAAAPKVDPVGKASVEADAPARTGIEEFRWPVRGRVIASFGDKMSYGRNDGIDISVPEGTAVKAVENGVVVYAGDELEGFGNLVLIRHSGGWVSAYGHNKEIDVKRGEEVRRGQTIARSGRTGKAEMPKLHFELRKGSTPVDPVKYLGG